VANNLLFCRTQFARNFEGKCTSNFPKFFCRSRTKVLPEKRR